jgi:ABC-type uncharacterized transport system ATPase subunit
MSQITIKNLEKTFRVEVKKTGFRNRINSIFKPEYKEVKAVS